VPEAKGSDETELAPEPWEVLSVRLIPFCDFYFLNLGIPFYGTQHTIVRHLILTHII